MIKNSIYLFTVLCTLLLINSCGHLKEAKISYQNQNYDKTITYCKQALKIDSTDTAALLLMGKCYEQKGLFDQALHLTMQAYQLSPDSKKIATQLLKIHTSIGDRNLNSNRQTALYHYQKANEIQPKNKKIQKKLADSFYALGQLKEAKTYYLKIKDKNNKTAVSDIITKIDQRIKKSQAFYKKGLIQYQQSNLEKAMYYFNQALEQYPHSEDATYYHHLTRGRILYEKGSINDLWDAIELFGKASALKANQGEPWYWMGLSYNKKDKDEFSNALDCLNKALKLEPDADFSPECQRKLEDIKKKEKKMEKFWGG